MFDSVRERAKSLHFELPIGAFTVPVGELDAEARAAIWNSFYSGQHPGHSPYYNGDITVKTLLLMIEQFKQSENLKTIITQFTDKCQEIENVADDLIMLRSINTASGVQLDGLGTIVGETRKGQSDKDYRTAILFRSYINQSSGQAETILTVLKTVTEATQVRIIEFFPATIYLFTDGINIPADLIVKLEKVSPAGVGINAVCSYGETPFEFAADGTIPYNEGDGFSEYNYTEGGQPVGGNFSEIIT